MYSVFDMLDGDCSGVIDFDGFYLLVCILVSIKVFIYMIVSCSHFDIYMNMSLCCVERLSSFRSSLDFL